MSADYTTTGLLRNTKRRGFTPTGSGLDTSALLEVLSEQLRTYIPAFLKGLREEYLIASLSIAITGPTVAAPARAVGAALRTAKWTASDGTKRQLPRIEPERRQDYPLTGSCPTVYMFEGDNLILVPAVSSGTLVLSYQQRPGTLVLPSACAKLTEAQDSFSWSVASKPSNIVVGSVCDIVSAAPNFRIKAMDVVVDSIPAPNDIEFVQELPADLAVGDYICLAGETPIPQLPPEIHDLLAQAAAYQVASDTGSTRLPAIKEALAELRAQLTTILTPRNDGSARVIVNRSGIGRRWR